MRLPALALAALLVPGCQDAAGSALAPHAHGPHDGLVAPFDGGFLEIKLHDDKGDLEMWLGADKELARPFDLPVTASVELEFVDKGGRRVTLRPRNTATNEDEAGNPNIRDGRTNYFIYPSREGEDASWLRGEDFSAEVVARFPSGGKTLASQRMKLSPHSH